MRMRTEVPGSKPGLPSNYFLLLLKRQLQQQNEELRRHLNHTTHKLEMMESDFESSRHYLETELNHAREEMDKLRDKFRRLQNSYTASQRTNQDLEDKLHALASISQSWIYAIKKAEMDKKTLDWEIVELTNKLLDAKTTIDRLEELNERYRQDCNLAVQLLKCNKSHFRNHKFSDLPYVLQEMVNKHMESSTELQSEKESSPLLVPSDVVPTSVIARVLEKPEPLILNSAQSSSGNQPMAEDVFVHVDMSGNTNGGRGSGKEGEQETGKPPNGVCKRQNSTDGAPDETATFERLNPYPTPPQNLFPGRKAVIEFSSDDKVKIPKNSPLPNCTYATRQAISLSLVQGEEDGFERHRTVPNSPSSDGRRSAQVSSKHLPQSPKPVPSAFASSTSSEEDLMANWQRMFVEKVAPTSERVIAHRTSFSSETARQLQNSLDSRMDGGSERQLLYSDGEEGRLMTDYGAEFSLEEGEQLLLHTASGNQPVSHHSTEPEELQKSPKRMGVHHLLRKDSLTRAQEQGTLLD
uniref:Tight junction associated protein 1 (peripheral) n=1 Tax=Callorhinchus milii TaxID=7868 RepID=A0A4W3KBD0_CALMI